jgi:hypothetical protein
VLDLDTTDVELHGRQAKRSFHGYYNHYCYLPLYICFCGDHLLRARRVVVKTEQLEGKQTPRDLVTSLAFVSVCELRRLALAGSEWAEAQVGTIRLRLLKVAARVRAIVRRVWVSYSSAHAWSKHFEAAFEALRA